MEWCFHISHEEVLESELALSPELARRFGSVRFTRIAYGTEFCEHLIPDSRAVRSARDAARNRGLEFTLLTPYVSDLGIVRLRRLLEVADGEVVFNDWGVLNLLRREFPHLIPVQGRLLNKSLRDPRITGIYAANTDSSPESPLRVLQQSNLSSPSYTSLLARFGVRRVEMDNMPQGQDLSFAGQGVRVSVYIPFGFVATARVCMAAGLHYRKPDKFQPGASCRHECQTHNVEYTYTNSPFENRDQTFLLKGNTYFYRQSERMLEALSAQAQSIDRIVYQPELPMFWRAAA